MGTVAGHHLPKDALTIGFEGEYDPKIFNQVGPMAVTKAYRKDQSGMNVYERAAFYPYNYLTSWNVFVNTEDPMQKLERLKRTSLSLHLYGHKTRNMAIHENSVLMAARSFFRVTEAELSYKLDHSWELRHPQHIGMAHDVEELAGFRIMASVEDKDQDIKINRIFSVTMSSTIGSFRLAESADWQSRLELNASSPALLNAQLSRLLFSKADNKESRGTISVFFRVSDANSGKSLLENHSTLSVYNLGKMTTIMVKTMGRMDKVFNLVSSCSNMYPEIKFIVSDDAANLTQTTGDKKKFYYLALPYDVGLSAGRNRMLELIETEYFVTLDDDFTCDANSKIDVLLHALETEGSGGTVYDIAAAKNPADEGRFGLDFCGHMSVRSQVLHLEPGKYESHQDCHRVDFVPNIFLGRTASFKNVIQWDETLKLGEHEDFFLRAKAKGIKTLTCPSISFQHNQVEHWLKKTAYDVLRNRVYDFWRDSLKKHGLTKLVSFGTTMMDLIRGFYLLC